LGSIGVPVLFRDEEATVVFHSDIRGRRSREGASHAVNLPDSSKYVFELLTPFKGGLNAGYLKPDIKHRHVFPFPFRGYTLLLKMLSPVLLCKCLVRRRYDV
jgi:hypothetical protein